MSDSKKIRDAIRKLAGDAQIQCFACEVVSVDWDKREAHVKHDSGIEFFHARLRAVLDDEKKGLALKPKINSMVLVNVIEAIETDVYVSLFTEVEEVYLEMENAKITIPQNGEATAEFKKLAVKADQITLNDGKNKGIPILDKIKANFDAIKNYLSAEKAAIASGFGAVGAGMSANGASGASAYNSAMQSQEINFEDMENSKVQH